MRLSSLVLLVPFALSGCLSYSGSSTPPPSQTVIVPARPMVVVPSTTVVCSNGLAPPC